MEVTYVNEFVFIMLEHKKYLNTHLLFLYHFELFHVAMGKCMRTNLYYKTDFYQNIHSQYECLNSYVKPIYIYKFKQIKSMGTLNFIY